MPNAPALGSLRSPSLRLAPKGQGRMEGRQFTPPRETRPTWAYPLDYRAALASSILFMPFPLGLPCGRPALEQPRRDKNERLFHVPCWLQERLGPLSTPAVLHSRRAMVEFPSLTACHFGPSLDQPRVACSWVTMLANVISLNPAVRQIAVCFSAPDMFNYAAEIIHFVLCRT